MYVYVTSVFVCVRIIGSDLGPYTNMALYKICFHSGEILDCGLQTSDAVHCCKCLPQVRKNLLQFSWRISLL